MKKVLRNCSAEKDLMEQNHLKAINRSEFCSFNVVIGKNGSGKSRFLRFLKDVAQKHKADVSEGMDIIFMDCTETDGYQGGSERIAGAFVFNRGQSAEALENLYPAFQEALAGIMVALGQAAGVTGNNVAEQLEEINQYLRKLLGRVLIIKEGIIYFVNDMDEEREIRQEINVLSPGERSILVISIALLSMKLDPARKILLLIDEPEVHLHPAALMDLFQMIRNNIPGENSCIFMATHSVFLLSAFKFEEICHFNNGELVKLRGRTYRDIMETLIYGEDGNPTILDFLTSVDSWSYAQYLAECFEAPTIVDRAENVDQQYLKLKSLIQERSRETTDTLQVLDYGAGDARVFRCMQMDYKEVRDKSMWPRIRYHVYDRYCMNHGIQDGEFVFGQSFPNAAELETQRGKMDIVLLYNVLHEIGIDKWEEELNLILSLLDRDGVLVFSERMTLSVGEKPFGKSGYLLLGEEELKILFEGMEMVPLSQAYPETSGQPRQQDKTWGFAIKGCSGKRISKDHIVRTLEKLETHTKAILNSYLDPEQPHEKPDAFKARDYAFYCQQYINVQYARKIMKKWEGEKEVELKKITLLFILQSNRTDSEKRCLIQKRAEIDDEVGQECRKYLEENS